MRRLPFFLLLLLSAVMAAATLLEKQAGSAAVSEAVYHSGWFILLWTALLLFSLPLLLGRTGRQQLRLPGLLLHGAFGLILIGALLTHLTSLSGILHLRRGVPENSFRSTHTRFWERDKADSRERLPFSITLEEFRIVRYPGTQAPADYASTVRIGPPLSPKSASTSGEKRQHFPAETLQEISMNRILRVEGYRLYQTSYDPDGQGSWLTVNYDPLGIPVTYAGYALLALSMGLLLLDPRGGFRRLLRHPALRRGAGALLFLLLPAASTQAGEAQLQPETRLKEATLPAPQAEELGRLQVLYNDRIAPLHTLAHDFALKLSGTARYRGFLPEQFLAGWLFYPGVWQSEPSIPIKNATLRARLGTGRKAALADLFGPAGEYRLQPLWASLDRSQAPTALEKSIVETDEKVQLAAMLRSGALLKVFPLRGEDGRIGWYAPTDSLPPGTGTDEARFVRGYFALLYESIAAHDHERVSQLIRGLAAYQQRAGGATLLSPAHIGAEIAYHRLEPTAWLYRFCLLLGLGGFLVFLFARPQSRLARRAGRTLDGAFLLAFLALTATVALRSYIAGRLPLGNGYETMLSLAWFLQLAALLLRRRLPMAPAFGLLLSGFALLVSTLGQMNPQITPLMPVLLSPWLSLHVSVIMMAYALFGFTCLCGIGALLLLRRKGAAQEVERLTVLSRLLLYPATFLLGIGIFVGAVWANVSWGTYWSWDPKEVWALISFLVYALPLHRRSLPFFERPAAYHIYTVAAFLTLLMTYFGVNYFLGGMHSYA